MLQLQKEILYLNSNFMNPFNFNLNPFLKCYGHSAFKNIDTTKTVLEDNF